VRLSGLLACVVLLNACDGPETTRHFFFFNRSGFERIVQLVDACRPTGRVTHNGRDWDGIPDDTSCTKVGQDVRALQRELTRNGFRDVSYSTREYDGVFFDPAREIWRVEIGAWGCQTYVFEVEADPNGSEHIHDAFADDFERYPLTKAPHHWFCESIGF
jgi:hypothetical protein